MTGADLLRDRLIAKRAADAYATMYDDLATDAQTQLGTGKPITSSITRNAAHIAARAAEGEFYDPEPIDRPWCDCSMCVAFLGRSRDGSDA